MATKIFGAIVFFSNKNLRHIKIHKTIIIPIALYECETLCLTIRKESRLRVFENRVSRKIFGPMKEKITEKDGENYAVRCFIISTFHVISMK
jgi:hypothetical protein